MMITIRILRPDGTHEVITLDDGSLVIVIDMSGREHFFLNVDRRVVPRGKQGEGDETCQK